MDPKSPIRYYDLTVRADVVEEDIFPVLKELRPKWDRMNVSSEAFTQGIVNSMTCFYHKDDEHKSDALMVRVYGAVVGDINPREKEFMNIQIAHSAGCFPAIYASFNNGYVYQYAVGRHTNFHDIVKPENIRTISHQLYKLHHVDIDKVPLVDRKGNSVSYDKTPRLFGQTVNYISSIPDAPKDFKRLPKFQQFRKDLNNQVLMEEFAYIKTIIDEVRLPVSFNHMDFHPRNIIINDETGDITFVDYEMSGFRYIYTDLALLFNIKEYYDLMGYSTADEPEFTPEVRELYLQSYLEAKHEAEGPSEIPEVEAELLDIKHSILGIMQCLQMIPMLLAMVDMSVNEKFDFLDFIPLLKKDYFTRKDMLFSLKSRYLELKNQALNPFAE